MRNSSLERLTQLRMFGKADCRVWRVAALAGFGRIADCIVGALRRKDARKLPEAGSSDLKHI
eukprot:14515592-Alexandrium_andersonii.AAC.1